MEKVSFESGVKLRWSDAQRKWWWWWWWWRTGERKMRWQWQGLIIDRLAKFFGKYIPCRDEVRYGGKSGCWLSKRNEKVDEREWQHQRNDLFSLVWPET